MRCSPVLLLLITLAAPAYAQIPYLRIQGEARSWQLSEVAPIGDVDQDGIIDLVLGAPGAWFVLKNQLIGGGAVQIVSGQDGHLLHPTIFGLNGDKFGFRVAGAYDFNRDGIPDFAGGSRQSDGLAGELDVWSGKTGSLLAKIPAVVPLGLGSNVAGLGDLDGDGFSEVAGSFDGNDDVVIHRGPDGALMRIHRSSDGSGNPGTGGVGQPRVASLGDVDFDGVPDYVIGWWADGTGMPSIGLVVLYSGASGKELYRVLGADVGAMFVGHSLARMGDMDGDGITDIVAGDPMGTFANFKKGRGAALILSGRDGSLIRRVDGPRLPRFANGINFARLDGGQDVNGDGVPDLVAGNFAADLQQPVGAGTVEVYSGATGTMLWRVGPGVASALLGDMDGDGLSEWAHGNPFHSQPGFYAGQVTVYLGSKGDAHRVCTAKPNSTGRKARLELDGPISLRANQLALYVEHAVPDQSGYFIYGPDLVSRPFGDGILCAGGGSLGLRRMGGLITLDSNGSVLTEIDMNQGAMASGPAAFTVGSTWTLQFYYRDPAGAAGFNLSDAMRVTWTP